MKKEFSVQLGQIADQDIRLLKVFKTVVECAGFAAAETELNISRSTISIHMANLEKRFNLKLCRRGRAGFSLTEEGTVVYKLLNELFSSLEAFRSGVNSLHIELTGELKIIVSDTICADPRSMLPAAIESFASHAPDVEVTLDVRTLTDIERMILNDEADIGFTPYHHKFNGLDYSPLYHDDLYLYCSYKHPLFKMHDGREIERKLRTSKVVHSGVHTSVEVAEQLSEMNRAAISYFYEARLAMILSGAYVGFMPDRYVQKYVRDGKLRALMPEKKHHTLKVAAITRSHGKAHRSRELFANLIQELHGKI